MIKRGRGAVQALPHHLAQFVRAEESDSRYFLSSTQMLRNWTGL